MCVCVCVYTCPPTQVHDEFLLEVRSNVLPRVALMVRDEMLHAWERQSSERRPLRVAFPVEINVGDTWGDMRLVQCTEVAEWERAHQ